MGFLVAGPPVLKLASDFAKVAAVEAATHKAVDEIGHKILASAQAQAPVLTGALRESGTFTMEGSIGHVVFGGGIVDYAVYVEFGTNDTPTFAFLRRGAEAAGYPVG